MSPSRLQAFRQRNRHRPVKQAVHLLGFSGLLLLYGFAFFTMQPDRSHRAIFSLNASLKEQAEARIEARKQPPVVTSAVATRETVKAAAITDPGTTTDALPRDPKENSATARMTNILFLFYAMALLSRLYIRNRVSGREARRRLRLLNEQRQARFRAWAEGLNFQRESNGQQPISLESLQLVMRERDMTGEDYDSLLQFDEEAGPAVEAMLSNIGASQADIDRCPLRTLDADDELLTRRDINVAQQCTICLEDFQLGQSVRTVPCFHSFHRECIDPWLEQRAVCPICKHSAIG